MECFDTFYSNDKQNMKYLLAYMKAMECKCDVSIEVDSFIYSCIDGNHCDKC